MTVLAFAVTRLLEVGRTSPAPAVRCSLKGTGVAYANVRLAFAVTIASGAFTGAPTSRRGRWPGPSAGRLVRKKCCRQKHESASAQTSKVRVLLLIVQPVGNEQSPFEEAIQDHVYVPLPALRVIGEDHVTELANLSTRGRSVGPSTKCDWSLAVLQAL
jgi:hypothetical protein